MRSLLVAAGLLLAAAPAYAGGNWTSPFECQSIGPDQPSFSNRPGWVLNKPGRVVLACPLANGGDRIFNILYADSDGIGPAATFRAYVNLGLFAPQVIPGTGCDYRSNLNPAVPPGFAKVQVLCRLGTVGSNTFPVVMVVLAVKAPGASVEFYGLD